MDKTIEIVVQVWYTHSEKRTYIDVVVGCYYSPQLFNIYGGKNQEVLQ